MLGVLTEKKLNGGGGGGRTLRSLQLGAAESPSRGRQDMRGGGWGGGVRVKKIISSKLVGA